LLGINQTNRAAFNAEMPKGRTNSWLQDLHEVDVWGHWKVTYRDVQILGPSNRLYAVYNLTDHDLSNAANRTALKALLLKAATLVDSDGNGLPDEWEQKHFGSLPSKPTDDPDGDGFDNRTEFAWGTDPTDAQSKPRLAYSITGDGQFMVSYYRWGGGVFNYSMEASSDLQTWDGSSLSVRYGNAQNLYDGSGRSQMTVYPTQQVKSYPRSFLRLLVIP
jgi:hypothetical protein